MTVDQMGISCLWRFWGLLELELHTVVSRLVGWDSNLHPVEEQSSTFVTAELSLNTVLTLFLFFKSLT